jgi:hypothetical protein
MSDQGTNFCTDQATGQVHSDGFTGPPLAGVAPGSYAPATHPSGASLGALLMLGQQLVAAAGTTQGSATAISASGGPVIMATTTTSTEGLKLPANITNEVWVVFIPGSHGVKVYPPTNSRIDALSTNAALTIAAGKAVLFYSRDSTRFVTLKGA